MKNSARFIIAYNKIDSCLRNIYNFNASMSFSELIRRCAERNYVVRSNEMLLIDYSRLRNAIVHKSEEEMVIAEPHDSVTLNIEHLAKLICLPPLAVTVFKNRKVVTINAETKLKNAIKLIKESNYSNIPVYNGDELMGILNNKIIVRKIADEIIKGSSIDNFLETETANILDESYFFTYYKLCNKKTTIDNIAQYFNENRKLIAVLITEHGIKKEKPICIITTFDLAEINGILDNYQI